MGEFPFLSVFLAVAAGAVFSLCVVGYRRRGKPGAGTFVLLSASTTVYVAIYAVSIAVSFGPLRILLGGFQWFGIAILPVTWVLFALEYSGRPEYLTRPTVLSLCLVPAISVGGVFADAFTEFGLVSEQSLLATYGDLFYASTSTTTWMGHTFVAHGLGELYVLHLGFAYLCLLAGVGILVEFVVRYDHLYQQQATSVVVATLIPWAGNLAAVLGATPIDGIDVLPFVVPFSVILFANAVFRHDLLDLTPATRRQGESTVVEEMRDAVVVVDDSDRVVDVNVAACECFDVAKTDALGTPLESVAGVTVADAGDRFEVEDASAVYEVTVSPVHDRYQREIGQTLVFRDITSYHDAQQRLSVLNRVLRHNLRTEVNVISGYAKLFEDELGGADAERAGEIATAADTLAALGQKAREVERIMSREDDGTGTFELSTLVANAIERVGTDHEVVVEESLPESVLVAVDPVVFEAVLGDLVDALVQYGDESGVVSLSVVVDGSDLVVAASNDGDGIPPEEYEVVLEGEETPLEHASGLSLWLVKWGVRNLNGDVVFDAAGGVELVIPGCVAATDSRVVQEGTTPPHDGSVAADGGSGDED